VPSRVPDQPVGQSPQASGILLAIRVHDSRRAFTLFKNVLGRLEQSRDAANAMMGEEANQSDDRSALMARVKQIVVAAHVPTDKQRIAEWVPQVRRFSFDPARDILVKPGPASNLP